MAMIEDIAASGAIIFASPVAVGHVRPLMPLARRFVERGFVVIWAMSGDDNEPASAWREPLTELGVLFVDVDQHAKFPRGRLEPFAMPIPASVIRRIAARANDVAAAAAGAIAAAVGGRRIIASVYDYFALWAYVAFRRLGVGSIEVVVSAFPAMLDSVLEASVADDAIYEREFAQLRASGFGSFEEPPRAAIIPADPALRVLSFTSPRLCPSSPPYVHLLGVQPEALPQIGDSAAVSEAQRALVSRLRGVRESGSPVFLLSMGTVVPRMFKRLGASHVASLQRLYTTLAASALRSGAFVLASTCGSSAADLGVDEAALGPAARDRVCSMSFVPQPLLFAHGLVDLMLMHGGANTFHEAVVSGVPLLISPGFGDQASVAQAASKLGVGLCVETITMPGLEGAVALERVATEILPDMLAKTNRWKSAAVSLAAQIKEENGLDAAEALVGCVGRSRVAPEENAADGSSPVIRRR